MARNKPKWIILHHTAVSYDRNSDQYEATKRYHISKGWGDIGYHYEISKSGKLYAGRAESAPGAHCYQQGMNYKSIGIVLDGYFDIEMPTEAQKATLKKLLLELTDKYDIPVKNIHPHRKYATYKSCPGRKLADNWAQALLTDGFDPVFAKKWEKNFIIDVDDKGKVYYIFNGKRMYIAPNEKLRDFVNNRGVVTGFRHKDVLRIPEGE